MKLVKLIEFPFFEENDGNLTVFEEGAYSIPFLIKRVFHVSSRKGSVRGNHAHIKCSQLLICSSGAIEVKCDDFFSKKNYILDRPNLGLLLLPGVWANETYLKDNTNLTVICDRLYEKDDYINNYSDFKVFAQSLKGGNN
jgi:dTDP-4-dehydrorhamnose 3,5-epimerase-like enzyme